MMTHRQLRDWIRSPEHGRAIDALRALAVRIKPRYRSNFESEWETRTLRSAANVLIRSKRTVRFHAPKPVPAIPAAGADR